MKAQRIGSKHFGTVTVPGKGLLFISYKTIVGLLPFNGAAIFTQRSYSVTTESHIRAATQHWDKRVNPRAFAKAVQAWGYDASINAAPVEF